MTPSLRDGSSDSPRDGSVTRRAAGTADVAARSAATIAHVAELAGVSTATVSRVLAGRSRGRGDSRARILAAARALDYRPSGVARSLKMRTTHTLGLLITDIQNPFFPEMVRAMEDRARERGYVLLLGSGADDAERERAFLELLSTRRVDGVLIATSGVTHRHSSWLGRARLPMVLVNSESPDGTIPAAMSDNEDGGHLAAEHLLALGHRRLGLVTVSRDDPAAAERLRGIRTAFAASALGDATLEVQHGDSSVASGEAATVRLLTAHAGVTAILCYNDVIAIGALRAIRASGRSIPGAMSVVGFDDIDLAAYAEPPLTTVAQDIPALGHWAVDRLLRMLTDRFPLDPRTGIATVRVPVRLVVRGSTGPVSRSDGGA